MSTVLPLVYLFLSSCFLSSVANTLFWGTYAATHHLNGLLVIGVAILGDCVNDALWFWAGRIAPLHRLVAHLPISTERRAAAYAVTKRGLEKNQLPFLLSIKSPFAMFTAGLCISALGAIGFPYGRFVLICAPLSAIWMTFYFAPFVLYGSNALQTLPHLRTVALAMLIAAVVGTLAYANLPRLKAMLRWRDNS